jgi:hypothetical protein
MTARKRRKKKGRKPYSLELRVVDQSSKRADANEVSSDHHDSNNSTTNAVKMGSSSPSSRAAAPASHFKDWKTTKV